MTTTIKVTSHNYPARVETFYSSGAKAPDRIIIPEDGEVQLYCTTDMELRIVDLQYDDPAVVEYKANRK